MSLGGGDSGGGGPQQVTNVTSNLPEYARPYFENLLERGQAESYREYTPYEGERLTGFTPAQLATQEEVMGMQTPGQYGVATGLAGSGGISSLAMGQQAADFGVTGGSQYGGLGAAYGDLGSRYGDLGTQYGDVGSQYGAQGVDIGQQAVGYGGMGAGIGAQAANIGADYFRAAADPRVTQMFMDPFMQNVVDIQQRKAVDAARQAQLRADLSAGRSGTYGGGRQAVLQAMREAGLRQEMGDIQATGLQKAYENAVNQLKFGSELGLRGYQTGIEGARTGIAGSQAGMEGIRTGIEGARTGIEGARTGIEGARTGITGAQTGLEGIRTGLEGFRTGLTGAQQATQAGATLADIGTAEQTADLQRLQAQSGVGAEQRALEQQILDQQYADFLRQRDYPMEQLGYYSALLRGLPMQMGSTQTTYAQPPSTVSQLGGLGLSALGISKLLG